MQGRRTDGEQLGTVCEFFIHGERWRENTLAERMLWTTKTGQAMLPTVMTTSLYPTRYDCPSDRTEASGPNETIEPWSLRLLLIETIGRQGIGPTESNHEYNRFPLSSGRLNCYANGPQW